MHRLPERQTRTFILRIWAEYLDQTPPTWRGEIENVTTREVSRFHTEEELMACIRCCFSEERETNDKGGKCHAS
jgi:hypothetical protein